MPILDADGKMVGDRMDNLIHASASIEEAEREIKLWFKPDDIPPGMRAFATVDTAEHFYFKGDRVLKEYEAGSLCVLAPGDVAWESDVRVLQAFHEGAPARDTLQAVVAKYLLNRRIALSW